MEIWWKLSNFNFSFSFNICNSYELHIGIIIYQFGLRSEHKRALHQYCILLSSLKMRSFFSASTSKNKTAPKLFGAIFCHFKWLEVPNVYTYLLSVNDVLQNVLQNNRLKCSFLFHGKIQFVEYSKVGVFWFYFYDMNQHEVHKCDRRMDSMHMTQKQQIMRVWNWK